MLNLEKVGDLLEYSEGGVRKEVRRKENIREYGDGRYDRSRYSFVNIYKFI